MDLRQSGNKPIVQRQPVYSHVHPMIPRQCVPEWKKDMENRKLIIKNAEDGFVPHFEHDDAMFLEKREQVHYNVEQRDRVEGRYQLPSREELLHPEMRNVTARYHSSTMYYK